MNKGDRVSWTYTHKLNRKSSTRITKEGVFVRHCKQSQKYGLANSFGMSNYAMVHFDGNKNPSRVLLSELTNIGGSDDN